MANNKTAKITALIALLAIIGSVIGTGTMIIYESITGTGNSTTETSEGSEATQEQLNQILKNLGNSGSTSSGETSTGVNLEVNDGTGIDAKTLVPTTK